VEIEDFAQLLSTASKYASTTTIRTFFEFCFSTNRTRFVKALNDRSMNMSAIHHAIVENRPQVVRLLIRYGASVVSCEKLPEFTPSRAMLKCLRRSSMKKKASAVKVSSSFSTNQVVTNKATLPHRLFDYISLHRLVGENVSNLKNADILFRFPEKDRSDFPFPNEYSSIFFAWPFLHEGWIQDHDPSVMSSVVSLFLNGKTCDDESFRVRDGVVTEVTKGPLRRGDVFVRIDGKALENHTVKEKKDDRIKYLLSAGCKHENTVHVEVLRRNDTSHDDRFVVFSTALHQASNLPTVYVTCLSFSGDNKEDSTSFALCLFSHYPFLHMQERLLRHLVDRVFSKPELLSNNKDNKSKQSLVSKLLDHTPLPVPGGPGVVLTTSSGIVCATFRLNRTHALPMVQSSMFDTLFSHFSAQSVLDILSHLMTSRSSVLIVSKRIDLLTPITEAILALLFPLRLVAHVYIPVLPPSAQYAGYLRSPIPLFAGIHTSAMVHVSSAGNNVICHADTGKIIPPIVSDGSKLVTIPGFISRVRIT